MAQYVVNGDRLTAIADAIRGKTGGTENLTLDQMPTEIAGIETEIPDEYIIPTGSVNITENGTHDVTDKASAVVDVPIPDGYIVPTGAETITENGEYDITEKASVVVAVPEREITLQNKEVTANGTYTADDGYDGIGQVTVNVASSGGGGGDIDSLIDRSITEISSNVTSIGNHAFNNCSKLISANFPNVTSVGNSAFSNCLKLVSVNIPLLTAIPQTMLDTCYVLENVDFPLATSIGNYALRYCRALTNVDFPLVTSIGNYAFHGCQLLTKADFASATNMGTFVFYQCYRLTAVVLRSETMCTLANINAFNNCYHILGTTHATYNPSGAKDGYIYVPRSLVDTYKADSVWSTYATQFRALEDYTVDGTTTGALDESKV